MEVIEAIRKRKSIRGFKPDVVPREIIKEILDTAIRSPSAQNCQPWEFAVVAGEVLEAVKKNNVELLASGLPPQPDFPMQKLEGAYRQRQVDVYAQLTGLVGIPREDRKKRAKWLQRGFSFFDAPVAILIYFNGSLDAARTHFDLGLISQTICLAALEYGLGTCICLQAVSYPEKLRQLSGIPQSKKIAISIAVGYPDWDLAANKLESQRESSENITAWLGYP